MSKVVIFNAVLFEGSKVLAIQCLLSALPFMCRQLSGFSESFEDIMDCRCWNPQILCNSAVRNVFKLLDYFPTDLFTNWQIHKVNLSPFMMLFLYQWACHCFQLICGMLQLFFEQLLHFPGHKLPLSRLFWKLQASHSEWVYVSKNTEFISLNIKHICIFSIQCMSKELTFYHILLYLHFTKRANHFFKLGL